MVGNLGAFDIAILAAYCVVVVGMGVYYTRKCRTAEEFMVAGRSIPAWAAGLAIMSTYTSSISYIATPGKAYDTNWHPFIFSLAIFPVAWLACRYAVPYYRKMKLLSVYEFLEERIGAWGRVYAALSFLLYIVGRTAVILYLVGLLLNQFLNWPIELIIVVVGVVTILYTLLGGMEAVIWTDVMQSVIMIGGLVFCVVSLSWRVCTGPEPLIQAAVDAHKFSLGSWDLSLSSRTIWVMIIYGVTENLRNLLADQNFVQKYSSVSTEQQARRSIWIAMLIYIPMTAVFLYIGTALFAFYSTWPGRFGGCQGRRGLSLLHRDAASGGSEGTRVGGDYGGRDEHGRFRPELLRDRSARRLLQALFQPAGERPGEPDVPARDDGRLGPAGDGLRDPDDPGQERPGHLVAGLRHLRRRHPRAVPAEPLACPADALAGSRRRRRQHRVHHLGHLRPSRRAGTRLAFVGYRPPSSRSSSAPSAPPPSSPSLWPSTFLTPAS